MAKPLELGFVPVKCNCEFVGGMQEALLIYIVYLYGTVVVRDLPKVLNVLMFTSNSDCKCCIKIPK